MLRLYKTKISGNDDFLKVFPEKNLQQELSYRKQITRQLPTQYVEGIHRPKYYTVTLKSRLRVKVTGNKTTEQIHSFIHSYSFNVQVDITQLQTDREARKEDRIYIYM